MKSNSKNLKRSAAILIGALILTACAGASPPSPIAVAGQRQLPTEIPTFAGARRDIIDGNDIYLLSAAQQEAFLGFFNDPKNKKIRPTKRLYKYLDLTARAFEYSEHTRTAAEVHSLEGGNCLSLANLTTALARLAGIEVGYQLMNDVPVFEMQENIILRGVHVRSILYDPPPAREPGTIQVSLLGAFMRTKLVIDYFPTGRGRFIRSISEADFTAMYYRNLAADAFARSDYSDAYWLNRKSFEFEPESAAAINLLAVLYRRTGDEKMAENVYRYGIALDGKEPVLLRNYRILLNEQGRLAEAEQIDRALARLEDDDPFDWWFMAEEAYEQANYADALDYYEKSVAIAPYLHEGYFGMAKTYYQLGRLEAADRAMRQALENAGRAKFRTLYAAKLAALSGEMGER